ncbi:MAG TPA: hypothetical protein VHD88_09425 [Pyrinomonadaceae bacterium]|nr:hypothetical protein [Pyrinomonadaceae bacterium]
MEKLFALILLTLLAATVSAQSETAQSSAAKSIQPAQTPAAIDGTAKTDSAPGLIISVQPTPPREIKIAAGTPLDIEAVYTVSSLDLKPGDLLSFRVLVPVMVDGVTLIDKNSLVTGRVVEAKRGRHWGKAGRLTWTIQDVVAADGTRVPLQAQKDLPTGRNGIKGTSHGGEVAAKTIVFSALLFPFSPLALMSGFKRGEDAVLPQGKRFVVFVQKETALKVQPER